MNLRHKMAVGITAFLMFLGTITGVAAEPVQAAASYASLQNSLNSIVNSSLSGTTVSVTVRKASNGEIVYSKNPELGVTPASSLKVLTASAALETLGENHRFKTEVLTDGQVSKGTLYGNLYLKGYGDPTLLKQDMDHFASILANRGVKRLSGNLIGDDTWFDAKRLSSGIAKEDEPYYYAAQISALTLSPNTDYDAGSVIVEAKPSVNGKPSKVTLTPATDVVRVINQSKTVAKGSKNTLSIKRENGTNKIIITGNVPIGSAGKKEWIAVSNPTAYALDVFKKSLASKGITFIPASKTVRGKTPEQARVLIAKQSMPLKQLIIPFLKLSNNTHAEHLAKEMGKAVYGEGSWESGLRVMSEYAASIGLDLSQWNFEDASGMSHANKVSSSQLTLLLQKVRLEPWYNTFLTGLPIAGADDRFVGGTLRTRMTTAPAKGNVVAKTGTLDKVSSLSGYIRTRDGELLVVSILTQDYRTSTVPTIDRMATAIANSKRN